MVKPIVAGLLDVLHALLLSLQSLSTFFELRTVDVTLVLDSLLVRKLPRRPSVRSRTSAGRYEVLSEEEMSSFRDLFSPRSLDMLE